MARRRSGLGNAPLTYCGAFASRSDAAQLLDAWRHSPYRAAVLRNYLAHEIGGHYGGFLFSQCL
jgi:hypothetical protein